MYLMIDNYDSFVYNLRTYFQEIGREILVKRCDELSLEDIENLQPEGIILSPGPKRPQDAFLCVEALKQFQGKIPVLGVCLGHQVIGYCSGASVQKGRTPMHGKITAIRHNGTGCFADGTAGFTSGYVPDRCSLGGRCSHGNLPPLFTCIRCAVSSGSRAYTVWARTA